MFTCCLQDELEFLWCRLPGIAGLAPLLSCLIALGPLAPPPAAQTDITLVLSSSEMVKKLEVLDYQVTSTPKHIT